MADPVARPSVLASLHTHSRYCDGEGEIKEYAEAALAAGLTAYGASGHAPLPFYCEYALPLASLDAYCADVRRVADEFRNRLPVYLGLELDYLPGLGDFYQRELFGRGLDYVVASVHYVGGEGVTAWAYDGSEGEFAREVTGRYGGDARPVVEDYYRRIAQMARDAATWPTPVIVGHFDRIVLWNTEDRYFPTKNDWYTGLVDVALDAIAEAKVILEINTSGWHKPIGQSNPDLPILRRAAQRGIRPMISADAHRPSDIARDFDRAIDRLREAGFSEIVVPAAAGWHCTPLPD